MKRRANRRADAVARDLRDDSAIGGAAGQGRRSAEPRHQKLRAVSHDDLQVGDGGTSGWHRGAYDAEASWRETDLTPPQKLQVRRWINGKDPRQYGFDFGLWTRQIVGALIAQEVRRAAGRDRGRAPACRVGHHAAETLAPRLRARSGRDQALDQRRCFPACAPAPSGSGRRSSSSTRRGSAPIKSSGAPGACGVRRRRCPRAGGARV